jgi:hypothetical protein
LIFAIPFKATSSKEPSLKILPPASSSTFLLTAPFATPVKIACNLFVCSSFNVDKYSLVPTFTALTYIPTSWRYYV